MQRSSARRIGQWEASAAGQRNTSQRGSLKPDCKMTAKTEPLASVPLHLRRVEGRRCRATEIKVIHRKELTPVFGTWAAKPPHEASRVKENIQVTRAGHTESPPAPSSRPLSELFRRENFKRNWRPERIPIPQMLSLRIITDNVVLIRRVEILARVQAACHLRIGQHGGCTQLMECEAAQGEQFKPFSCIPWVGRGLSTHGTD